MSKTKFLLRALFNDFCQFKNFHLEYKKYGIQIGQFLSKKYLEKDIDCLDCKSFYLPYILAYKSENFGRFFVSKKTIRLIHGSL